jgi:hypothetical protein
MKNKLRRKGDVSKCRDLQSISFQLRLKAIDVGLIPYFIDWCRGSGLQLDSRVVFDVGASNGDQTNISFGLSGTLNQFKMCQTPKREQVMSWDKIQSSVDLILPRICDSGGTVQTSRRLMASSITFPSGICLIRREKNTWITSFSVSRRVHLSLGNHICFGIDLESVHRILLLLQDTPFLHLAKKNLAINDNDGSNKKNEKKSSTQIVELNVNINMHVFTFMSKVCDEKGRSTLDFFSFESPGNVLRYKQSVESLPDTPYDQIRNDVELQEELAKLGGSRVPGGIQGGVGISIIDASK